MRTIRKRVSHPTRRCFFQRERGRIAQILCGRSNDASGRRRCEFDECRAVIVGVLPVGRSLRFNLTIESKGIHIVVGSSHTMSPPPLPPRLLRLPPRRLQVGLQSTVVCDSWQCSPSPTASSGHRSVSIAT